LCAESAIHECCTNSKWSFSALKRFQGSICILIPSQTKKLNTVIQRLEASQKSV
jgi:hypothetical protein